MTIQQEAIDAYQMEDASASEAVRHYGAALCFAGIADNGGLMGGGIQNCRETEDVEAITDAVAAFKAFGLHDVAELIELADKEYLRIEELEDELPEEEIDEIWESMDEKWFALDINAQLDRLEDKIK